MKKILLIFLLAPICLKAQTNEVEGAEVNVFVTDFKNKPLDKEVIIFRSVVDAEEYNGTTDETGKFTLLLPVGEKYEIFILGFKDSTSYNFIDIPATKANTSYKDAFKVDIKFMPSKTFVLQDCNFETGKSILEPESYTVIDELYAYLLRKSDENIEIGGYTDNVGKPAANLKLSEERAIAVKNYLISKGIEESRVKAKGYGMANPIADNKTEEGRAQNRRTEVKILN